MRKSGFYKSKSVARTEWWLHSCELPRLRWARLTVFDDGTADSCFEEGGKLYGFEDRSYAGHTLSEDEYIGFEVMDQEDEKEYSISLADITPPEW